MTMDTPDLQPVSVYGSDLERWRIENGLSREAAADALGLPKARWEAFTKPENAGERITDPTVAMLVHLYQSQPESAPFQQPPDIKEFYEFLGLTDRPQDRELFAALIGRSAPSVYRLMLHDGNPSRPVIRWMEAIRRLKLTPKKSLRLMHDVAAAVLNRKPPGAI